MRWNNRGLALSLLLAFGAGAVLFAAGQAHALGLKRLLGEAVETTEQTLTDVKESADDAVEDVVESVEGGAQDLIAEGDDLLVASIDAAKPLLQGAEDWLIDGTPLSEILIDAIGQVSLGGGARLIAIVESDSVDAEALVTTASLRHRDAATLAWQNKPGALEAATRTLSGAVAAESVLMVGGLLEGTGLTKALHDPDNEWLVRFDCRSLPASAVILQVFVVQPGLLQGEAVVVAADFAATEPACGGDVATIPLGQGGDQ